MTYLSPSVPADRIRNFAIIAHIDHGKSTLADRLIESTSAVAARDMRDQVLDTMDLERERGITIKLQTVRMMHTAPDGSIYQLNLIDTPGHVDFTGEVARSLAAADGVLLLVDATQGLQAQTVANLRIARGLDLPVLPVVNKIDSPLADLDTVVDALSSLDGIDPDDAVLVSARTGEGVDELLAAIVRLLPAPSGRVDGPLRALVFDSHFDPYRGVVLHVRVVDGTLRSGERLIGLSERATITPSDVGVFAPTTTATGVLRAGEVGYASSLVKDATLIRPGDTLVHAGTAESRPLMPPTDQAPMVYAGLFAADDVPVSSLRRALERLALNDAALKYTAESSNALGAGFRCGFLGMLHLEIVQERLRREYGIETIATMPTVPYRVHLRSGAEVEIDNPLDLPGAQQRAGIDELYVVAEVLTPPDTVGAVIELCQRHRGEHRGLDLTNPHTAALRYAMPLSETIVDFFSELKSLTAGYATVDFTPDGYRASDLVRVDILVDTVAVDAFAFIAHRDAAFERSSHLITQLKHTLPQQLYPIPLQAVVEGKVIGRADLPPIRKSALAQGFQGSASAKKRLAERQRSSRSRAQGNRLSKADIPPAVFRAILGR